MKLTGSGSGERLPSRRWSMKRILVGVDGSKESRDAAAYAAELAQALGSLLLIASVSDVPVALAAPELVQRAAEWQEESSKHSTAIAKDIARSVARSGLTVETIVESGPAAETLAELARAGDVDLVVVGHRGRNAVSRALMGSVADRLVQICAKPVLVVR
jgi:nucleotide-binding universal stress UspA family protein